MSPPLCLSSSLILPALLHLSHAYYLTYHSLHRSPAESFCIDQCNSHLASIHNSKDFQNIINLWENDPIFSSPNSVQWYGNDVWTGLSHDRTNNVYEWSDNSLFDFGADISGGVYPWAQGQPSTGEYVQMVNSSNNIEWDTVNDTVQHSIVACNDCPFNTINKFISVAWVWRDWNAAQLFCETQFGTSLASIHSQTDYDEAKRLCGYNDNICFIGYTDQGRDTNHFAWSDGTSVDMGWDQSQWPWLTNMPDNQGGDDDCVILDSGNGYQWDDAKCYDVRQFLCNKPSELCYASNWNGVNNKWSFGDCEVTNNNNGAGYEMITLDISAKQWKPVTISYRWKINDYYNGKTGVVINIQGYDDSVVYKFFVGFEFVDTGPDSDQIDSFVEFNGTVIHRSSSYDYIWDQTGFKYNEMKVELDINCILKANLIEGTNNWQFINYAEICNYIPNNYFIKSVGIQNYLIPTTAKSFFINGAYNMDAPTNAPTNYPTYAPTMPPSQPTSAPTTPSTQPTQYPTTSNPTSSPTLIPTATPIIIPTSTPIINPTQNPTMPPTLFPSKVPSALPTKSPSNIPTKVPSNVPTESPSALPTQSPSKHPTNGPTNSREVSNDSTTTHDSDNNHFDSQKNNEFFVSDLVLGIIIGAVVFGLIVVLILWVCLCYVKRLKKRITTVQDDNELHISKGKDVKSCEILNEKELMPNVIKINSLSNENNNIGIELHDLHEGMGNYALGNDMNMTMEGSSSDDEMYEQNNDTPFGANSDNTPFEPAARPPEIQPRRATSVGSDEDMYRADLVTISSPPVSTHSTSGFESN